MMTLLMMALALGADWVSIQGTEPPDEAKAHFRPLAFVQVSAEGYLARPVEGLQSEGLQPHEGELAVFNTVAPSGRPWAVSLRRVRLGARGELPGTHRIVSISAAAELGQNALTTTAAGWLPKLMDASISLHSPWGVHLRLGQFKLPLSDEALEAVHMSSDLVRFTPVTGRLLMERDASSGVYSGTVNGFRDIGGELFGAHRVGPIELSWAAMVSSGSVLLSSVPPGPDVSGRLQVAWRLDEATRNPERDELSAWGFATSGLRDVAGQSIRRTRAGAGVQLRYAGVRLRGEFVHADGVLNAGMAPPFQGGTRTVAPEGEAWGATALASVRFATHWELGAQYAHLDSQPDAGPARRVFDEAMGFAQYHLNRHLWVDLNVGWRDGRAPEGSEDAQRVLATMAPYAALMVTATL